MDSTPCTDNTQISWSVLLDQKMIREGVQYRYILYRIEDGGEMCTLIHSRSIGDRTYTANQHFVAGEFKDETFETTLAEFEVANFEKDWEDNWHPMIGERLVNFHNLYFL